MNYKTDHDLQLSLILASIHICRLVFRLSALQETGLYDLIVNDDAFNLFDSQNRENGI